jgi:photosystem II stability/assembly factor-like uncharacterized protein
VDPDDSYEIHFFQDSGVGNDPYSKGVIASEFGNVYTTTDGGDSWITVHVLSDIGVLCPNIFAGHNLEFWGLDFEDPLDSTSAGWVAGGVGNINGYIFRTSSGGAGGTWEQPPCYEFLDLNSSPPVMSCGLTTQYAVAALDQASSRAVSVGYGAEVSIYEPDLANYDPCAGPCGPGMGPTCLPGDLTWVQEDSQPTLPDPCDARPPLLAAAKISNSVAAMAGHFGRILRYDVNASPPEDIVIDTASRYFARLNDGEFINSTTGCVIGQARTIWRTTNNGVTWNVVSPWVCDGNAQGKGLDFSSNWSNGVAVGSGGFIAHSSDSGQSWTELVPPPQPLTLNAVAFMPPFLIPPPTTVYAVGSAGVVLRSDDQGVTWASLPRAGTENLFGVSFANPSVGYVVGAKRSVYRTINGGQSWNPVGVVGGNPGETFFDVETWGSGTPAILVGQNGGVYERTAGRFVKQTLGLTVTENLNDVQVINLGTDVVRICGDNGVVLFRDSGVWTKPRSLTNEPLFKLAFQGSGHGFAVGKNFLIAEYRL